MALNLMYLTNDEQVAQIADKNGVDWIFIDLEINGKEERQGPSGTVISRHNITDIKKVKNVLTNSKLLVRINPICKNSKEEINKVIENGADIIMLPFFKTLVEVEQFINYVDNRCKVCLLVETPEAVDAIDDILNLDGIDFIHIGLNDLHLGYKKKFMFELLCDGTVEMLCNKFKKKNLTYGFGGIAQLGHGDLPSEHIIAEHYRLNSSMVILARTFCNTKKNTDLDKINDLFSKEVLKIRNYELELQVKPKSFYLENQNIIKEEVNQIISKR